MPLIRGFQELSGVIEDYAGYVFAAEHAGYFVGAVIVGDLCDGGPCTPIFYAFSDAVVVRSEGCDLGKVGDADDLMAG